MLSLPRKLFRAGCRYLAGCLLCAGTLAAVGQVAVSPQGPPPAANQGTGRVGVGPDEEADSPILRHAALQAEKKRNEQRQQQIVKDTEKLSQLVQQLKDEVGNSAGSAAVSVSVARKAEEIEKLARSVKDKMKAQ